MRVLVLNCGSSSIKYKLYDDDQQLAEGLLEKIGTAEAQLNHTITGRKKVVSVHEVLEHHAGIELILQVLVDPEKGVLRSIEDIQAVGHRVVHGAESFSESTLITPEVVAKIEECIDIAPLHNPPNLAGIYAISQLLPKVPQVAVFDTAFHQTMPEKAFMYAIPYVFYARNHIRRYGFHGISHYFVSREAATMLGRDINELKLITCHLGNGSSIAAVDHGKSADTSMGFTPLEGLPMGTRCGDIDPAVPLYIMGKEELNLQQINALLNKHSGVLGISGISNDFRTLEEESAKGDKRATLALEVFCYKLKKYIGSYIAVMNGADAVVFTGGIGENSDIVREMVVKDMEFLGMELDADANRAKRRGEGSVISTSSSRIKILVIPTNEELVIARDTRRIAASN
ncbi:MAG TPA: acetate kinase [Candidatus Deferrimicrobium sp.]|nr:acetate kinase [Candidatus Deferrimicrobium sp.]